MKKLILALSLISGHLASAQGELTLIGTEQVGAAAISVRVPASGPVFPGIPVSGSIYDGFGTRIGPEMDWASFAAQYAAVPKTGNEYRILVDLSPRRFMAFRDGLGRENSSTCTLEPAELGRIRESLALAAAYLRIESKGARNPIIDIRIENSVDPLTAFPFNEKPFDTDEGDNVFGYQTCIPIGPTDYFGDERPITNFSVARTIIRKLQLDEVAREISANAECGIPDSAPTKINLQETSGNWKFEGKATGNCTAEGDAKSLTMTEKSHYADGYVTLFRAPGNGLRTTSMHLSFTTLSQKFSTNDFIAVDASGQILSRVQMPTTETPGTEPIATSVLIPSSKGALVSEVRLVSHGITSADHARNAGTITLNGIELTPAQAELSTPPIRATDRLAALNSNDTARSRAALIELCTSQTVDQKIPSSILLQLGRDLNRDVAMYATKAIVRGVSDAPDTAGLLWELVRKAPFEHNQMFAMKALAAMQGVTAPKGGEDYAAVALTAEDWQTREAAVQLLGALKTDAAQTRLLVFVADPDPRVRAMLCRQADLKNDLANQRLLYLAVNDPYELVRGTAYSRLLSSPKDAFKKEALSFFNDESPAVPAFVVQHMAPFTMEVFQKAIVHRSPKVRAAALRRADASFKVGLKEIEPVLNDDDQSVQFALVNLFSFHRELINSKTTQHLRESKFAHIRQKAENLK